MFRKLAASAVAVLGLAVVGSTPAAAVVGGTTAIAGTAPYQVSIRAEGWSGLSHVCGGFLLTANKVVTAAHCVDGLTASKLEVGWGGLNRSSLPDKSKVSKISIHPQWNAQSLEADVAVLTLTTAAGESGGVRFARLAATDPSPGAVGTVTGWGRTRSVDPSLPERLQAAELPIVSHAACQEAYSGANRDLGRGGGENNPPEGLAPVVSDGMLCAGSADGGAASICQGDAGGPLTVKGQLVGIASWGDVSCGTATTSPSVFTSVAKYRTWIERQ